MSDITISFLLIHR